MSLRLIMLGDIVGQVGLDAVRRALPALRETYRPDLVLANAENVANGSGLTPTQFQRLIDSGVHGVTLGDHAFKRKQIVSTLERDGRIIRPANLSPEAAGRPWMRLELPEPTDASATRGPPVFVTTVLGRLFVNLPANDPFACVDTVLSQLPQKDPLVIVEVHAEATSEKKALGWYLDGRVAAVLGTHTHVATADAEILPKGTAYITDLGMSGPHRGVIGRKVEPVLKHMRTAMPVPFDVAEEDLRVCGVYLELDPETRKARRIERIEKRMEQ